MRDLIFAATHKLGDVRVPARVREGGRGRGGAGVAVCQGRGGKEDGEGRTERGMKKES